mmetsp:Transcript_38743/g.65215  ORF Transcript_38743/g.65215 Transcript_38743/m.65215 type:complete len:211 (-) Transcript_38743:1145-1777(-)
MPGELGRVSEKVLHDLLDPALVAHGRGDVRGDVGGELHRVRHDGGDEPDAVHQHLPQVHWLLFDHQPMSGSDLGRVQQVVHDVQQPHPAVVDERQKLRLLISQRPGALAQHSAGEANDGIEGRAQLVRDGRHERRFLLQDRLLFDDELPAADLLLLLGEDGQLLRGAQAKVLPQNAHEGHLGKSMASVHCDLRGGKVDIADGVDILDDGE